MRNKASIAKGRTRRLVAAAGAMSLLLTPVVAHAQVAGSTVLGVATAELRQVALGWSARRQVLGRKVFNEKSDELGTVDDIIVTPDKNVSYIILNAGNLVLRHDVALPVSRFTVVADKLTLSGATRDGLSKSPPFEYK